MPNQETIPPSLGCYMYHYGLLEPYLCSSYRLFASTQLHYALAYKAQATVINFGVSSLSVNRAYKYSISNTGLDIAHTRLSLLHFRRVHL